MRDSTVSASSRVGSSGRHKRNSASHTSGRTSRGARQTRTASSASLSLCLPSSQEVLSSSTCHVARWGNDKANEKRVLWTWPQARASMPTDTGASGAVVGTWSSTGCGAVHPPTASTPKQNHRRWRLEHGNSDAEATFLATRRHLDERGEQLFGMELKPGSANLDGSRHYRGQCRSSAAVATV